MQMIRRFSTEIPRKTSSSLRGGILGFFIGVSATSLFVYNYVLNDNNVVLKDVLSLNKSIKVLEEHVKALEDKAR